MTTQNDNISVGWFGIPGRNGGRVHVVRNGKLLCGEKPHPKAEYFQNAPYLLFEYVECLRCKERAKRLPHAPNWERYL